MQLRKVSRNKLIKDRGSKNFGSWNQYRQAIKYQENEQKVETAVDLFPIIMCQEILISKIEHHLIQTFMPRILPVLIHSLRAPNPHILLKITGLRILSIASKTWSKTSIIQSG